MNCEFCNETFSSQKSMNKHKNTAKYCLKMQGRESPEKNIISCEYCKKNFASTQSLERHLNICKYVDCKEQMTILEEKYKEQMTILEEKHKEQLHAKEIEIAELKATIKIYKTSDEYIKEIAKQPNKKNTDDEEEDYDIHAKKRLSLDIQSYLDKDVLYVFEFKPIVENMQEPTLLENNKLHYFEFGVTSNIRQRQTQYGSGFRLDNAFAYDSGFKASLAESYIKKLVSDMGLKLSYKNKLECMYATYKELEQIYKLITEHNFKSKNSEKTNIDEYTFEIQKLHIEKEIEFEKMNIEKEKLKNNSELEMGKLKNNEELIKMMKEGQITFDQFKQCFGY